MSVLSFKKSIDQLDETTEQLELLQSTLSHCILTAGQYAVELRHQDVEMLRANLKPLAEAAAQVSHPAGAERLQSSFRGEMRVYQDRAHAEVSRLKEEIASVMESMQSFMMGVGGTTEDLKQTLHQEFAALEETAESENIETIRTAIHNTVEAATRSCEDAQRAQEFTIAQLQDEIRNLHRVVDHERRVALSDPVTGVWNRTKLDNRVKDLILLNEGFCVFFLGLPDAQLAGGDPRVGQELLKAVVGRLQSIAGKNGELGMVGRWSEDIFAVVFNLPLASAPITPAAMQHSLSGAYILQIAGGAVEQNVEVHVGAVERPKDFAEGAFYLQLGQAAFHATAR